jgi:hypothetical protein
MSADSLKLLPLEGVEKAAHRIDPADSKMLRITACSDGKILGENSRSTFVVI